METTKQPSPSPAGSWKRRLGSSAVISAALAFTLCLFGPLDLFFNNYEEFWFQLGDILPGAALVALAVFVMATALGVLLRGKLHEIYIALLFGGLLGLYVQGSFMNKDYGSLDGTAVDWSAYTSYGVVNTIVWAVCLLLPLVLMLILKEKKVRPALLFLSCALIIMQGASLVVSYVNYPKVTESAVLSTDGIYQLSPGHNTIVFVLDTMDERYFQQLMEENPDYTQQLNGFTCYDNAMAGGARTTVALPLLLTGLPRTVPGTYSEYLSYIWSNETLFQDMQKAGYDTRLYTESQFVSTEAQGVIDNLELTDSSVSNTPGLVKKMYKLTLYKYVPHFLKWRFWMYTGDFDKFQTDTEYVMDDAQFYQNYQAAGGFTYSGGDNAFRLYHLMGAHKPYTLTSGGTRKGSTTSLRRQMEGCFHILFDMLDNMRENGVYDQADIFIMADHGAKSHCQYAMLLYKPAGETGPYQVSNAPVSLLDVTATLDAIAGGDYKAVSTGTQLSQVKEGAKRTRSFYYNVGSNALFVTGEYQSTGHASDGDAMQLVNKYQVMDMTDAAEYTLGTVLSFANRSSTANAYCTHGFRAATEDTTHMEGRYGQMVIPIANAPADGSLDVRIGFSSMMNLGQIHHGTTQVSVGGETVYEQVIDKDYDGKKEIHFTVPVTALEDGKLTIDFTFPDLPEEEEDKPEGSRMQTLKLTTLVITAAE